MVQVVCGLGTLLGPKIILCVLVCLHIFTWIFRKIALHVNADRETCSALAGATESDKSVRPKCYSEICDLFDINLVNANNRGTKATQTKQTSRSLLLHIYANAFHTKTCFHTKCKPASR